MHRSVLPWSATRFLLRGPSIAALAMAALGCAAGPRPSEKPAAQALAGTAAAAPVASHATRSPPTAPAPPLGYPIPNWDASDGEAANAESFATRWFEDRGVKDSSSDALARRAGLGRDDVSCFAKVPAPKPFGEAALCERYRIDGYLRKGRFIIVAVDGDRLPVLWEHPATVSVLDDNAVPIAYVQLQVRVREDGLTLVVEDYPDRPCASLPARSPELHRSVPRPAEELTQADHAAQEVCEGRGTFVWNGKGFVAESRGERR